MESLNYSNALTERAAGFNSTPHPEHRFSLYKCKNLCKSNAANQEERRIRMLQEQKKRRNAKFDEHRHITDLADDEETSEMLTDFHVTAVLKQTPQQYTGGQGKQMMFSEWLIDVPSDFFTNWLAVPCPEGKRCIVIAKKNKTTAYAKNGRSFLEFRSNLPGGHYSCGNKSENSNRTTVLDCIFNFPKSTFHILDVIQWGVLNMLECETEFRFYWLVTKLKEVDGLDVFSKSNQYAFNMLPRQPVEQLESLMSTYPQFPHNIPPIDGILFYHKETHYTAGQTPLVVWLKAFMVPEVLSVTVADGYLSEKPQDYTTYGNYIEAYNESRVANKVKSRRKSSQAMKMDSQECKDPEEKLACKDELPEVSTIMETEH